MKSLAQDVGHRLRQYPLLEKKKPGLLRRERELEEAERARRASSDSLARADRGSLHLRFASDTRVRRAAAALRRQQALRSR